MKKKPYEQQFGVYIFCVTTISSKIVKKLATTTTTKKKKKKKKEKEKKKKIFCRMNDVYFLRSISKGKQNRRKPWPTTELSPKLAFPGIECQIIISVKDSYDISGSKIPLHTCHSRRLGYAHAPIYLQLYRCLRQ